MSIFLTADLHLNHDKEFVYRQRGFATIKDMNEAIISAINYNVMPEDDLYILGDICMGKSAEEAVEYLNRIDCKLHLVWGNHDTDAKKEAYKAVPSIVEAQNAIYLKYRKYHFYLSHYPTLTGNEENKPLKQQLINVHGHTHQWYPYTPEYPLMFHVGVDTSLHPFNIDDIINFMEEKE